MIRIAEMIPPTPSLVWKLARQAGVDYAVGGLPTEELINDGEELWDFGPLARMKQRYNDAGFKLEVIEARPPFNKAKRGQEGRDEEIDGICTLIENMGELDIPVWCYSWATDFGWLRTSPTTPSRGGSYVTSYDHSLMQDAPPTADGPISEGELWENLHYFLERVLPVAEKAGVTLAMHPDDPPISPIRGVSRIMRSIENYQRLIDMIPSPANQIALCQGNFTLMTDDLPGVIRHFGEQKKIAFVHFRDVQGTVEKFAEAWHDDGNTDMLECMRAYRDVGYEGVLRPDHVPTVSGDSNDHAGYSAYGRLYAIGYIRGLQEAVYNAR